MGKTRPCLVRRIASLILWEIKSSFIRMVWFLKKDKSYEFVSFRFKYGFTLDENKTHSNSRSNKKFFKNFIFFL
jgi:hypothetical protein